jgi:hypothetical protein
MEKIFPFFSFLSSSFFLSPFFFKSLPISLIKLILEHASFEICILMQNSLFIHEGNGGRTFYAF